MEFNPVALEQKRSHLDAIHADPARLARVLRALLSDAPYELTPLARPWEPGGGASLYRVTTAAAAYFLKVKHLAVTVESKLECEAAFSPEPSLRNEQRLLRRFAGAPFAPVVHGYAEDGDHAFLLLEWLTPFEAVAATLGAAALADAFGAVTAAVRTLYEAGVVHTDLHEKNLMFRGATPVLVDFEEARELAQPVPFERSLDVVGRTDQGDVGAMPEGPGRIGGLTCLDRLHAVVAELVRPQLETLIQSCNFDSSCPFLATLDHGRDERVYQTIQVPGLTIAGQRPADDPRVPVIAAVGARLFDRPYTHLDVGANIGMFAIAMARRPEVARSIGVEAYDRYVELAKVLAFLSRAEHAEFHCAVAGEDSLVERLGGRRVDLVTIYSVYHHIRNKERFLADLAALGPSYVMLEMASQPECYEGRSWESELERIARGLAMPYGEVLGQSADYARPIVVLSRLPLPAKLLAAAPAASPARGAPLAAPPPSGASTPSRATAAAPPRHGAGPDRGRGAPRVSVVLPVYNHLRFLPEAIGSVLAQTYTDFELVIVNDGSTDGTREYLDTLADPRIVVVHQENRRLPGALNTGFARACGELLTWTSADNHCAPLFLEALVGALDRFPEAGFAYAAFAWIDDESRITGIHRDQEVTVRSLLKQNPGIAAFLYRRACRDAVGEYDPALDGAEDWDMWLRIVERFPAVYVPEILYYYRLHADSMTVKHRERVAAASRQVVRNAIARRGRLDIEELFPTLAACRDRGEAELYACADFGTALLQSPWAPLELAAAFLDAACSVRPEPAAVANYAIACARLGRFAEVRRCLEHLRGVAHTDVRRLVVALDAAAHAERSDLAMALAPFGIDTTGVELFERERAARRVFSLTDPERAATVAPSAPPRPAPSGAAAHAAGDRTAAAPAASAPDAAPPAPAPAAVRPRASHRDHAGGVRRPTVSVIVPTHDRPDMLRGALGSILAQTYRDFEIVVVNDCGVDVQHVIDGLDHQGRISAVRHAVNRGLAAARNTGLGVARGRFVAYLDDDDVFYPEHLETLVPLLEQRPDAVFYTDALRVVQVRDATGHRTVARDRPYSNDFDRFRLLVRNQFPVLCVMHARDGWAAVGGFDESLTSHEDWDFWLRLSARFPFQHVASITADFTHRLDGSSMTSGIRPDFLRTAEIIYARTAADVAGRADLQEARARFLAELRAQIGAAGEARSAGFGAATAADGAAAFDCSIVIPVFNRAELTEQCLVALAAVTAGVTFEVIVVDNASTDRTPELCAALGGDVQILVNAENLGFAAACNQGARAARGRYVVFLNNDTIPLDGWLAPLARELDADPTVQVVGSKLLFADGTVQHAGVIFGREVPLPYHAFAHTPGTLPAVNERREMQSVTGACMAVRRDAFLALGGFDEGYRNGFEDVDFCLRVRTRGGRVIYQPASTLYHLESQTPGRKAHDDANVKRFLERWIAQWHHLGDEDAVLVPAGWCVRDAGRDDQKKLLATIRDAEEQRRWEAVARLQRALRADDAATLHEMLTARCDWPADTAVARWVERLRKLLGLADAATAAHA
ncbi:MAG: glycosyltransferase [Deltaproteobacteria bacterium]|nr:glycosyltransferase [Deltaproteobacteria bacterium]